MINEKQYKFKANLTDNDLDAHKASIILFKCLCLAGFQASEGIVNRLDEDDQKFFEVIEVPALKDCT